jgi:D-alanine-D-alanine ligase
MRIAVLANLKSNAPTWDGMSPDRWADLDSSGTIESLLAALQSGGHDAEFFEANPSPPFNLAGRLLAYQPDLCFNIAEGHYGAARESLIPCLLDMLEIPYTASGPLALALSLDKPTTKHFMVYHGLPTPEFQVLVAPDDPINPEFLDENGALRCPLFAKPSREGTSIGITASNIVRTVDELRTQVTRLYEHYRQPILCERYIQGREVMIGLLGNLPPTADHQFDEPPASLTYLPPLEVDFSAYSESEAGLYTNRMKTEWANDFHYLCPAPLDPDTGRELRRLAASMFHAIDCKDMARVDFRLDELDGNKPYILEINPLPGLAPGYSDLCLQSNAAGWSYEQLVNTIVELAAARHGLPVQR